MSLLITENYLTAISNLESFFKIYNDTKLKDKVVFDEKIDDIENLHNYEYVEENIKKYKLKVDELFNIINKISILIDKINSLPPHVVTLFLNGLREEQYEKVKYYQVEIEKIKKNIKHLENYLKLFEFYNLVSESLLKILNSNLNHDSIIPIHSCLINIRSGFSCSLDSNISKNENIMSFLKLLNANFNDSFIDITEKNKDKIDISICLIRKFILKTELDDIDNKILFRFGSSTPKKRKKLSSTKFKIGDIVIIHNRFSDLNNTEAKIIEINNNKCLVKFLDSKFVTISFDFLVLKNDFDCTGALLDLKSKKQKISNNEEEDSQEKILIFEKNNKPKQVLLKIPKHQLISKTRSSSREIKFKGNTCTKNFIKKSQVAKKESPVSVVVKESPVVRIVPSQKRNIKVINAELGKLPSGKEIAKVAVKSALSEMIKENISNDEFSTGTRVKIVNCIFGEASTYNEKIGVIIGEKLSWKKIKIDNSDVIVPVRLKNLIKCDNNSNSEEMLDKEIDIIDDFKIACGHDPNEGVVDTIEDSTESFTIESFKFKVDSFNIGENSKKFSGRKKNLVFIECSNRTCNNKYCLPFENSYKFDKNWRCIDCNQLNVCQVCTLINDSRARKCECCNSLLGRPRSLLR